MTIGIIVFLTIGFTIGMSCFSLFLMCFIYFDKALVCHTCDIKIDYNCGNDIVYRGIMYTLCDGCCRAYESFTSLRNMFDIK